MKRARPSNERTNERTNEACSRFSSSSSFSSEERGANCASERVWLERSSRCHILPLRERERLKQKKRGRKNWGGNTTTVSQKWFFRGYILTSLLSHHNGREEIIKLSRNENDIFLISSIKVIEFSPFILAQFSPRWKYAENISKNLFISFSLPPAATANRE